MKNKNITWTSLLVEYSRQCAPTRHAYFVEEDVVKTWRLARRKNKNRPATHELYCVYMQCPIKEESGSWMFQYNPKNVLWFTSPSLSGHHFHEFMGYLSTRGNHASMQVQVLPDRPWTPLEYWNRLWLNGNHLSFINILLFLFI